MPYKVLGCKVNKYFLNQRLDFFSKTWNNLEDTLLIATCVVTDRAKNKRLREVKIALKGWLQVAITWCWSLERGNLIDINKFFDIYPELLPWSKQITLLPESPTWSFSSLHNIYTKHFLVIQNWCDNHCSFCLTVSKRWAHVSRKLEEIIDEIHEVECNWGKEIVITWINLAARGCSNSVKYEETKFPYLLREILKRTSIPRIRISSIWPEYANDEFFEVVSEDRIMPHFHYSVQSFSTNVLKNMWRHYSWDELRAVLNKTRNVRRNDGCLVSIWADIIVWFPWESESDFMETFNGIEEYWITKLHAFPFSDHTQREWIPASKFWNQIDYQTKKEREDRLIQQWDKIRENFLQQNKWTSHKVLVEERKNWKRRGWTENYIQVEIEWDYERWNIITDYSL